jgi:hypothetical protein
MLAASGTAFASVDQTSPQWAEIGPRGYTGDQSTSGRTAESGPSGQGRTSRHHAALRAPRQ